MILQADDGGNYIEGVQASFEAFNLAGDDGLCALGLLAAIGDMGADSLLQIVDVVSKDAVELRHFLGNVARDGDVDEEHGTIFAPGKELFSVFAAEYCMGRA